MNTICYICGRPLTDNKRSFNERVHAYVKPRVGRTRFYCVYCWEQEVKAWKGEKHGKKEK